jgi:hypothetical protein
MNGFAPKDSNNSSSNNSKQQQLMRRKSFAQRISDRSDYVAVPIQYAKGQVLH